MLSLLTPQSQQNLTCTPGKGEPHSWQNLASGAELPLLDTSDKGETSKCCRPSSEGVINM